ncbi:Crp/Fnr family transcriptional regulator [Magnetofaba australis]|uniref:Putative cyclic nucleotide-binding protein n=1 Tax=Magnetofaba australis IT-1 TaxID=1434232 RepID=A0A1Y2K1J0_9PROT|nr:cyclic nucleotide-binding domain-containing protein [Magnetofaba australis]OSM01900.1 putative cyclic nucleotide-binding protein [Magnetofaba australis IT-1]
MADIPAQLVTSILSTSGVLAGVDRNSFEKMLQHPDVKMVTYKKGHYIYRHGDAAENCWIVLKGRLVTETLSLRKPFHESCLQVGEITGLMGVLDPGAKWPVSLVTDNKSELIEIPGRVIREAEGNLWPVMAANVARIMMYHLIDCRSQMDR